MTVTRKGQLLLLIKANQNQRTTALGHKQTYEYNIWLHYIGKI